MDNYKKKKSIINIEKSIKSLYVFKYIFSFLNENQKLNILIYNKELQKELDINSQIYKRISKRYRVGERNGKGKEYDYDDKLKFEGEYLNGKRNGKGKEYDYDNKVIFEGEYLNGVRNGKGKEYYDNSKIKFEGDYLEGKRWNGKGYNKDGILEFELKEGNGKVKENNFYGKLIYEGEYLNGEKN